MDPSFTPLVPASEISATRNKKDCHLKVRSPHGINIQPIAARKVAAEIVPLPPAAPAVAADGDAVAVQKKTEPTVGLIRDGDRVIKIQVRCSCGELIELDCEY